MDGKTRGFGELKDSFDGYQRYLLESKSFHVIDDLPDSTNRPLYRELFRQTYKTGSSHRQLLVINTTGIL